MLLSFLFCAFLAYISSSVDANHDLVSPSRATKPCSTLGSRYSEQSSIMWCTVCSGCPHSHSAESFTPHSFMEDAANARSVAVECCPLLARKFCTGDLIWQLDELVEPRVVCNSSPFRIPAMLIHVYLDVSGSMSRRSWWICTAKMWREFSRAHCGGS